MNTTRLLPCPEFRVLLAAVILAACSDTSSPDDPSSGIRAAMAVADSQMASSGGVYLLKKGWSVRRGMGASRSIPPDASF